MQAYQMSGDEVAASLNTNVETGLSGKQSTELLRKFGQNVLPKKEAAGPFTVLLRQFLSPLMFILLFAAIASLLINQVNDAIVIAIAMLLNVVVGFFQEWKAERAAAALRAFEIEYCTVRRDGSKQKIEARNLVPGDVVVLEAGSKLPADIRLTEVVDFTVEEALLTGESKPIQKIVEPILQESAALGDRTNMGFLGTFALSGRAEGIVVDTGIRTELGDIATLALEATDDVTPIQRQLKRFSWFLGWLMIAMTVTIVGIGVLSGMPVIDILEIAIALAVSAIPEGLLVAVTVILAIGMQRMLRRKALVKKLVAAESLGSVSVICTDKTGTLTVGHLSATRLVTQNHDVAPSDRIADEVYDLLVMGALNNDSHASLTTKKRLGDPTEIALVLGALTAKIDVQAKREKFARSDEIPFSSDRKFMATVHVGDGNERLIVKGAPEVVLEMCDEATRTHFAPLAQELTKAGLRVLALAYKDASSINLENDLTGLTCVGLFGLEDALRPQAKATVQTLRDAGVRTVLVTGDHVQTALHVAKGAGITTHDDGVLSGSDLEKMSDDELCAQIEDIDVFARVSPRHKVRIVKAWQAKKRFVAMTGDGVNDAPSLRAADIGVALGAGSDLSHEVADIVLLDNDLSTIVAAVREGRTIFDNIRKVILYLLTDSFEEVVLVVGSLLMGLPLPLTAVQILWINLVSDGLPDIALTMEPGEPEIMREPPRPYGEPILSRSMKQLIFVVALMADVVFFGLYLGLLRLDYDLAHLRTIMFIVASINSLLYVFSVRSMRKSIFEIPFFSNPWIFPAVLGGLAIQFSAIYVPALQKLFNTVPLSQGDWLLIVALCPVKIIAIELAKLWFRMRRT